MGRLGSVKPAASWSPEELLSWAWHEYAPRIALSSSFQTQSLPLLHMVSRTTPEMPVLFIDTGFHFPETLVFRDRLTAEWGLNVRIVRPAADEFRPGLFGQDPDACCLVHKVEPLRRAMQGLLAWISGIRRDQTGDRATGEAVEKVGDLVRVHPLLEWTSQDVWKYINAHDLPTHPLLAKGYLSIGCSPCTRPVHDGEDERAGRWAGQAKMECGLHTALRPNQRGPSK